MADFLAIDGECADELSFPKQRDEQKGPGTGDINELGKLDVARNVGPLGSHVGNMNDLLVLDDADQRNIRMQVARQKRHLSRLGVGLRRLVKRNSAKSLTVVKK